MARRVVIAALVCAAALVLPNALWLFRSTCEIRNDGRVALEAIGLRLGGHVMDVGTVPPGAVRMVLLPRVGEGELSVSFRTTSGAHHGCGVYVEGYMYHVAVKLREDAEPECAVSLPLFSDLLGWRFLVSLGSGA